MPRTIRYHLDEHIDFAVAQGLRRRGIDVTTLVGASVMIPLTIDVPMRRLPWANWMLILATVAISIAFPYVSGERFAFLPSSETRREYSSLVLQRNDFAPHQLVTSLFQHAGLLHLIGNMLFLFVFGNAVNAKLGHAGFLISYLGIGVLENLVWLMLGWEDACLGASAAIMGLCGMFLVLYPFNSVQVLWDDFEIAFLLRSWASEIPGWAVVLLYLAFDIWGAVFDRGSHIGYVSHIIGGLLGIASAIFLLRAGWLKPDRGEQTLLMWFAGEGPAKQDMARRSRRQKRGRTLRLQKGEE
jgi:membrane associated rhomboid family serine protease